MKIKIFLLAFFWGMISQTVIAQKNNVLKKSLDICFDWHTGVGSYSDFFQLNTDFHISLTTPKIYEDEEA